jgi:hypothetical protein
MEFTVSGDCCNAGSIADELTITERPNVLSWHHARRMNPRSFWRRFHQFFRTRFFCRHPVGTYGGTGISASARGHAVLSNRFIYNQSQAVLHSDTTTHSPPNGPVIGRVPQPNAFRNRIRIGMGRQPLQRPMPSRKCGVRSCHRISLLTAAPGQRPSK